MSKSCIIELEKIAQTAGLKRFSPEKFEDIFSAESFDVTLENTNYTLSADLSRYMLDSIYEIWDMIEPYFVSHTKPEKRQEMELEFLQVHYLGDVADFVSKYSSMYNMPFEFILMDEILNYVLIDSNEPNNDMDEYARSEIGKALGKGNSIEDYVKALEKWNEIDPCTIFRVGKYSLALDNDADFEYFEKIFIDLVKYLADKQELCDISPILELNTPPPKERYGPLFKLLNAYQAKYESQISRP